jgi:FAD:protein FMN transferase
VRQPSDSVGAATTFDALGTYVYVATHAPLDLARATALATEILRDVDETCSRFREDSDLSAVNRYAGQWVDVDSLLIEAVTVACSAAEQTEGLVNPLLGRPLVNLGYDRTFTELTEVGPPGLVALPAPPDVNAWRQIEIDPLGALRIPEDTALDLGATGKAWAADAIARAFSLELSDGAIVSVGGDLAIAHRESEQEFGEFGEAGSTSLAWPVAISEHPNAPADETITLSGGGLATSSNQVRQWTRDGVRRHHLLDPRTGLPCAEVWRTVTATGPSCTAANIATTAAMVLGKSAPEWLSERDVTARLVDVFGRVRTTGAWGR